MDMKNDFFIEKNVFGVCCEDKLARKAPICWGLCTANVYQIVCVLSDKELVPSVDDALEVVSLQRSATD